jgi:hypothetical protein
MARHFRAEMPSARMLGLLVFASLMFFSDGQTGSTEACFPTLGSSSLAHCMLPYSWKELAYGYKTGQLDFKTGGLGECASNHFRVWLCIRPHPCLENVLDRFCFVYNETSQDFIPIGKNKDIKMCSVEYLPRPSDMQLTCCDAAAATLSMMEARIQSLNTTFTSVVRPLPFATVLNDNGMSGPLRSLCLESNFCLYVST